MNNTFNASRFGLLLRRQWIENRKVFLASTAILFGSICLFYIFNILSDSFVQKNSHHVTGIDAYLYFRFSSLRFREAVLVLSGILYVCLLSGHYFTSLSKPATAIQELTIPVSATEKLLSALLSCSVLSMLTFAAVFSVADAAFVTTIKAIYSDVTFENEAVKLSQANYGYEHTGFKYIYETLDRGTLTTLPVSGFLLSTVFTLGSVYFRRFSFIKTSSIVIAFIGSLVSAQQLLNNLIRKGQVRVSEFTTTRDSELLALFILAAIAGALWAATYFRLKEKEV